MNLLCLHDHIVITLEGDFKKIFRYDSGYISLSNGWHQWEPALLAIRWMPWLAFFVVFRPHQEPHEGACHFEHNLQFTFNYSIVVLDVGVLVFGVIVEKLLKHVAELFRASAFLQK